MDSELKSEFDSIYKRLDQLSKRLDRLSSASPEKSKTSTWKGVAIAVPVIVAVIGVLATGYELGLKLLSNHQNRQTIEFYTTLARNLAENGNYDAAKLYLTRATDIDDNNSEVVSTRAFIDIMDWVRRTVSTNPEALRDARYSLSMLNLSPDEVYYHIGTVAVQEKRPETLCLKSVAKKETPFLHLV